MSLRAAYNSNVVPPWFYLQACVHRPKPLCTYCGHKKKITGPAALSWYGPTLTLITLAR